ncbi:Hypothetical protein PHPALM_9179 [Phytophthora palmivora]|uniref:Uncharacterized protein n=1 Tax=Phytophthora palmivora TaxID=4796 RepID=A0A2P4Y7Y2_9STRA|nr:Hypothetical protein PHPALM_9179 [Phytophthora palmivora]
MYKTPIKRVHLTWGEKAGIIERPGQHQAIRAVTEYTLPAAPNKATICRILKSSSLEADNDTGKAVAKLYPLISTSAERKKKLKQLFILGTSTQAIELMRSQHKRRGGCPVSAQILQFKPLGVASERSFLADIFTASYSWRLHKFRAEVCEMVVKYNISTVLNAEDACSRRVHLFDANR